MPSRTRTTPTTAQSYALIVFTNPPAGTATLTPDSGVSIPSQPMTDGEGRQGFGFPLPPGTPQGHGARLRLDRDGQTPIDHRGKLVLNDGSIQNYPWKPGQTALLDCDDFTFIPLLGPAPGPDPIPPPTGDDPMSIINAVFATGKYNLQTLTGCGLFTEACCTALHEQHAEGWGHIRKTGGQQQFNGHAIDAVLLLRPQMDGTQAGVYDIIFQSGAPDAKPAFNFQHGVDSETAQLWYYPAAPIAPGTDVQKLLILGDD